MPFMEKGAREPVMNTILMGTVSGQSIQTEVWSDVSMMLMATW